MDRFFGAGVASHQTIIEQINYLLFMRALSEKDDEYLELGVSDPDKIVFDGELSKYKWDNLMSLNAEALFIAIQKCFDEIPKSTTNSTVRLIFRNAHLKLYDKPTLRIVLHELDEFANSAEELNRSGKRDIFGDIYEYLLSKLSQAGTSGQFRTPRHIIEFIIEAIEPKKGETILDPAVGTAGFLVKAFEYLEKEYTSTEFAATGGAFDKLTAKEQSFLYEHTFSGFDSDEDMIKFGMMNLYLHGLENAHLVRQNSLTDTAGNRDKYDIIVANPPFSGKIDRDSVAQELQMNTAATEVLFLRYILEHINANGRGGVIVPEGVLFNASAAHTKIRELLLENGLWCVVSLPAGVFNPYAGVKTSIVFFDKSRVNNKEVLFANVERDGFSLSAQRRVIAQNDLPNIMEDIKNYQLGEPLQHLSGHIVSYDAIAKSQQYLLSASRYKVVELTTNQKYEEIALGDIFDMQNGRAFKKDEWRDKGIPIIRIANLNNVDSTYNYYDGEYDLKILIKTNDLLFSWSGTKGTSFGPHIWNRGDGLLNQHIFKLIPKIEINTNYAYLVLKQLVPEIESKAHGAGGLVHITKSELNKFKIPLPPMKIQNEIVSELNTYQRIIDGARQVIENYSPTITINTSWPIKTLSEITNKITDGSHNPPKSSDNIDSIPMLSSKNIYDGIVIFDEARMLSPEDFERENKRTNISDGDVLLTIVGTVGRTAVVRNYKPFTLQRSVAVIKPDNNLVISEFLKSVLDTQDIQQYMQLHAHGVAQKGIYLGQVSKIEIPIPPLDIQKQIVERLEFEQKLINSNKELIKIYDKKISDRLNKI